jgi:hypothetical protein
MPPGEADVSALIHAKVAAGLLPRYRPDRVWVGPGSDNVCDGCDQAITKEQREYEFDPRARPRSACTRTAWPRGTSSG